MKHKITRRIPRKPGTQVVYTPEQTERYKSLAPRLQKASALVGAIEEISSERPGRVLYFFPSDRAPAPPGGWLVTIDENEPPAPEPPLPGLGPAGEPPLSGNPQPTRNTVFVAHLRNGYRPGLPPEVATAQGRIVIGFQAIQNGVPLTSIDVPWITGERAASGFVFRDRVEAPNLFKVIAPLAARGQSLNQLGGGYWVGGGAIYTLRGPIPPDIRPLVLLFRYVPRPGESVPAFYSPDPDYRAFPPPYDLDEPLTTNALLFGPPVSAIAYPFGVDPFDPTPAAPPGDPAAPDQPQDPPLPEDPERAHYECNCPDFIRVELQDVTSEFPSRWRDRTWIDSDAGAPVDEEGRAYCKHVLAAMLKRGDTLPSIP